MIEKCQDLDVYQFRKGKLHLAGPSATQLTADHPGFASLSAVGMAQSRLLGTYSSPDC